MHTACVSAHRCDPASIILVSVVSGPMSGPSQRTEGAHKGPTTQSLTHLACRTAGSKQDAETGARHKHAALA